MENNLNKVKKIRNRAKRLSRRVMSFTLVLISVVSFAAVPAKKVKAANLNEMNFSKTIQAVGNGTMAAGAMTGQAWLSGLGMAVDILGLGLDFYNTFSDSGSYQGNYGNINTRSYYNGDTTRYRVFKNNYSTSNNYSFYNPITNNYNETNNFYYNQEYNTYYYDYTTNNYIYNNYITNNNTYVSYYIIEQDTSTASKVEYYYEFYFKLPDGRNSHELKTEDIWGKYFIYDYTTYKNVPEDDGKTLGLWHLDGDLRDSSYWANSYGSSYTSTYRDGRFNGGKYFGNSTSEYLTLKLDNATLPANWTLEWIQYDRPDTSQSSLSSGSRTRNKSKIFSMHKSSGKIGNYPYYMICDIEYIDTQFVKNYTGAFMSTPAYSYTQCALVKNGSTYTFYSNGNKMSSYSSIPRGLIVNNDNIKFYATTSSHITNTGSRISQGIYQGGGWVFKASSSSDMSILNKYFTSAWLESNKQYPDGVNKGWFCGIREFVRTDIDTSTIVNTDIIIDEVRLSSGVLYDGNYVPSNQSFTTNTVLAVPDNGVENQIAFKTERALGSVRVGGARPTYPSNGDIFINVEDDIIKTVQQYQDDGWYEIDGAIYRNGNWEQLKNFDMKDYVIHNPDGDDFVEELPEEPDPEKPDNNGDNNVDNQGSGGNTGNDNNGGNDSKSIWDRIADLITALFGAVSKILGAIIEGLATLITNITDALGSLSGLTGEFGDFLKAIFVFIPDEIIDVLILGVTLCVFAAVIKIFV